MGTKSKVTGVIFNVLSFILFGAAMIPSNWSDGNGPSAGFALWAYSVMFALISVIAYTVGVFKALKSGGSVFQLVFSISMLILCVYVGAAFDTTCMIIWNAAFFVNLILQIHWLKN